VTTRGRKTLPSHNLEICLEDKTCHIVVRRLQRSLVRKTQAVLSSEETHADPVRGVLTKNRKGR